MKKFLIGCAIFVFLCGLCCAGGLFYTWYQGSQMVASWEKSATSLKELNTKHPFTPPADDKLDEERLKAFFALRDAAIDKVMADPDAAALLNNDGQQVSGWDAMRIMFSYSREVLNFVVMEMDRSSFSPDEYGHITRLVYQTVAQGNAEGDKDMKEIYESLASGTDQVNAALQQSNQARNQVAFVTTMDFLPQVDATTLQHNMDLLRQFKEKLLREPRLAFAELALLMKGQSAGILTKMEGELERARQALPDSLPALPGT